MLACAFGCDEVFERGALSVDENGLLGVAEDAPPRVKKNLQHLKGRLLSVFGDRTAPYFGRQTSDFLFRDDECFTDGALTGSK